MTICQLQNKCIQSKRRNLANAKAGYLTEMFFYQIELEDINKPGQLLVHHTEAVLLHPTSFVVLQSELDKLKNGSQTM